MVLRMKLYLGLVCLFVSVWSYVGKQDETLFISQELKVRLSWNLIVGFVISSFDEVDRGYPG
jgi:hypothetical protein